MWKGMCEFWIGHVNVIRNSQLATIDVFIEVIVANTGTIYKNKIKNGIIYEVIQKRFCHAQHVMRNMGNMKCDVNKKWKFCNVNFISKYYMWIVMSEIKPV